MCLILDPALALAPAGMLAGEMVGAASEPNPEEETDELKKYPIRFSADNSFLCALYMNNLDSCLFASSNKGKIIINDWAITEFMATHSIGSADLFELCARYQIEYDPTQGSPLYNIFLNYYSKLNPGTQARIQAKDRPYYIFAMATRTNILTCDKRFADTVNKFKIEVAINKTFGPVAWLLPNALLFMPAHIPSL